MRALTISIEACAAICHEANKAYNLYVTNNQDHVSWDESPEVHKLSMRNGVVAALMGMTPEQQHEKWREEKKNQGWKYAPTKDSLKKTHPCLLPYEKLPVQEQVKDHLFQAIVGVFTETSSNI